MGAEPSAVIPDGVTKEIQGQLADLQARYGELEEEHVSHQTAALRITTHFRRAEDQAEGRNGGALNSARTPVDDSFKAGKAEQDSR